MVQICLQVMARTPRDWESSLWDLAAVPGMGLMVVTVWMMDAAGTVFTQKLSGWNGRWTPSKSEFME